MNNKRLLEEANLILERSANRHISYIGPKPWYERKISKLKFGFMLGIVAGVAAVGISTTIIKEKEEIKKVSNVVIGTITKSIEKSYLDKFKEDHKNIDFDKIESQRDVVREFIGTNNFIALAAEMEGFRGDLHKDPATGLNIGFGYNISKRIGETTKEVEEDLRAIGIDEETVKKVIEIAKKPQKELSLEIKKFNLTLENDDNQLISIEQGIALLKRTQKEYALQAKTSFGKSFDKMGKNQQEVLTYAAYKAGYDALSKYKKAIKAAEDVYEKSKQPGMKELKTIAKELTFYYKKDGREWVLDKRASLIAQTLVHQDYLAIQVGKYDDLEHTKEKLYKQKIDFSNLKTTLDKKETKVDVTFKKDILEKFREDKLDSKNSKKTNRI